MPPVTAAINDLWQVRVKGFLAGQEYNNVLHFKAETASADVETDLALKIIECFVTHLLPGLHNQMILDTLVWKRVSPTLGPDIITPFPGGSIGQVSVGDFLPSFTAALVSIRTAEGGRSKRGRMFLAGLPESGVTGNSILQSSLTWTSIVAFVACVVTAFIDNAELGTGRFGLGVYSRVIGGSAFPYGAAGFTRATLLSPVALVATMRSRKQGRGN